MAESGEQKSTEASIESFRIHRFDPVRRRKNILLGLLAFGVVGAALFVSGYTYSQYQADGKLRPDDNLQRRVKILNKQATELKSRTAGLEQSADVDSMAVKEMQLTLNARELEIAKLKEELSFYQSLLSPDEIKPGLSVQSLSLRQLEDTQNYTYHIVLTVMHVDKNEAKGSIEMSVNGTRGGVSQSLSLTDISARTEDTLRYEFRYFQRFEGSFTLPEEFEPLDVSILVRPDSKEREDIKVDFPWETALHEVESSLF